MYCWKQTHKPTLLKQAILTWNVALENENFCSSYSFSHPFDKSIKKKTNKLSLPLFWATFNICRFTECRTHYIPPRENELCVRERTCFLKKKKTLTVPYWADESTDWPTDAANKNVCAPSHSESYSKSKQRERKVNNICFVVSKSNPPSYLLWRTR